MSSWIRSHCTERSAQTKEAHVTGRVDRRQFVRLGGLASGIAAGLPRFAFGGPVDDRSDPTVRLSGDGLGLTPAQYTALLNQLVETAGFAPDSYSLGGIVEQ